MIEKESPVCPECGYVMCERFDEKPLKDGFSYLVPNGTFKCYHCGLEVKPEEQG